MVTYMPMWWVPRGSSVAGTCCGGFTRSRCLRFCRSFRIPSICIWSSAQSQSFWSAAGSATFRRLSGDEDFGLVSGKDITRDHGTAGLFLRRVRPLHRTLPGQQHRQGTESETDRARDALLSERVWKRQRNADPQRNRFAKGRSFNAPPAAPANISVRSAFSICR